jgi:hypothetical protein
MDGFVRVQIPASNDVQMMFDLALPTDKDRPERLGYVDQEVHSISEHTIKILQDFLRRSPGLIARDGNVALNYAVIDGKLSYVFQISVHTR